MRCPKCGNELSREESFCGQCGAPTQHSAGPPVLPARPGTGAIHHAPTDAPAPRTGGLLQSYNTQSNPPEGSFNWPRGEFPNNTQSAPASNLYNTNTVPPPSINHGATDPFNTQSSSYPPGTMPPQANSYNLRTPAPSPSAYPPGTGVINHPPTGSGTRSTYRGDAPFPPSPSGLQQPKSFYQDATEAMVVSPANGNSNYPQSGPLGAPPQGSWPAMYNPPLQPFQTGNYTSPGYPPVQPFPPGQGYNYGIQPNVSAPHKQRGNAFLVVVCVLFVVAFLLAAGVGLLYLLRNQSSQATTPATTSAPQATTIPSPTLSPTTIPSPTPVPSPSPALTPTPAPVPGFSYCDASCTTNGYSVEYPSTWRQGTTSDSTGVEFKNPTVHDEYAAFKATSSSGSDTANDLVNNDLQNNFVSQQDYAAPTSSQSTTIGGVTWVYSVATYTLKNQTERIEVYATVRQGRNYVIELQAPDAQFDDINSRYFVTMLGNFQFQSGS